MPGHTATSDPPNDYWRIGPAAINLEQGHQFGVRHTCEHRGVGDLVAVEIKDWYDRAIVDRVEELVLV